MAKQAVDVLIEGGKATAAPPLGPALGPLGVNIGKVVADINKKTEGFKGMQVPVKVTVDSDTKEYTISIGTPPASALIKKEAGLDKGATNAKTEKVADLSIVQVIKIAKMKEDALLGKDLRQKIKEIIGTCQSMGVMVEGMAAHDAILAVNQGKWADEIKSGKTELSAEELKRLQEERKRLQDELKARREEFMAKGKSILKEMEGKPNKDIRARMADAGLPNAIINELAPEAKDDKKKK
ncbi:TPA: 50S ribosomal protein L11 [Candidatus Woesearchaeota archaeon]|nr:50S ribosomal protein L11 [Candidatus Woesearchaeota archaeon]